ncbi:hypothetical protein [Streptomyces sp. KL116D]|uniref:hypothetical protein n=1 Tax=Streptomyces sp. KL116D TaxID=3045152 RepID=UPI003555DAD3
MAAAVATSPNASSQRLQGVHQLGLVLRVVVEQAGERGRGAVSAGGREVGQVEISASV